MKKTPKHKGFKEPVINYGVVMKKTSDSVWEFWGAPDKTLEQAETLRCKLQRIYSVDETQIVKTTTTYEIVNEDHRK